MMKYKLLILLFISVFFVNAESANAEMVGEANFNTVKRFEKLCGSGGAPSCYSLGDIYLMGGDRIPQDLKRAFEYYDKACELDFAEGCYKVGDAYYTGSSYYKKDREKARTYLTKACVLNSYKGCGALGELLFYFGHSDDDITKALSALEKACTISTDTDSPCLIYWTIGIAEGFNNKKRALDYFKGLCPTDKDKNVKMTPNKSYACQIVKENK